MPTGSGLDAQLGFAAESTWGTPVTPGKFLEFDSESIAFTPTFIEPTGLRVGTKHKRAARVRQSRKSVEGDIAFQVPSRGVGLLWKHLMGSAITVPTQIAASTAWRQIHTPGDYRGLGLTMQVGRPEPRTGTVRPFTLAGCKFSGFEFAVEDGSIPTVTASVLGRSESVATALATAAYPAGAEVFDFSQVTLRLGG
ncbi:MAG: phage tail tube protein, partial [Phycicoccus sp.]